MMLRPGSNHDQDCEWQTVDPVARKDENGSSSPLLAPLDRIQIGPEDRISLSVSSQIGRLQAHRIKAVDMASTAEGEQKQLRLSCWWSETRRKGSGMAEWVPSAGRAMRFLCSMLVVANGPRILGFLARMATPEPGSQAGSQLSQSGGTGVSDSGSSPRFGRIVLISLNGCCRRVWNDA